jgi:hypothetical protein
VPIRISQNENLKRFFAAGPEELQEVENAAERDGKSLAE